MRDSVRVKKGGRVGMVRVKRRIRVDGRVSGLF
jgi:hypothetical protein